MKNEKTCSIIPLFIFILFGIVLLFGCHNPVSTPTVSTVPTVKVTTLAGGGSSLNAVGIAASFNGPFGIASDGINVYVSEIDDNLIRKIAIKSGVVTTLAGGGMGLSTNAVGTDASFNQPQGLATDGVNVYVADWGNNLIREININSSLVTTLAGSGLAGSLNAAGTGASFSGPTGVATDGINVYVADWGNNLIRQININSLVVETLAGGGPGTSTNGTGTDASFFYPNNLCTDGSNLYVVSSDNLVRKIVINSKVVTTLAGGGTGITINGTGLAAIFNLPEGIDTDGTNIYIADSGNNLIRQIVIGTGVVITLAGNGSPGAENGTGSSASFNNPFAIAINRNNNKQIFVADGGNNLIRQITLP